MIHKLVKMYLKIKPLWIYLIIFSDASFAMLYVEIEHYSTYENQCSVQDS